MKITERMLAKVDLSREEAKVARHHYNLPSSGRKTKEWVKSLSDDEYNQLLTSVRKKLSG